MSGSASGRRLLLVEDESIIALSERKELERKGYSVSVTYRGEDAVEAIAGDSGIDLVLMDIDLGPGWTGPRRRRASWPSGTCP